MTWAQAFYESSPYLAGAAVIIALVWGIVQQDRQL